LSKIWHSLDSDLVDYFWNFLILANDRFTFNLEFCDCTLGSILQGLLSSQGVLNKDPTIWLDRARPANTYVPPFFLGTCRFSLVAYPPPKIHLQVYNIERDRKHDVPVENVTCYKYKELARERV
jgi:hypothetical protein